MDKHTTDITKIKRIQIWIIFLLIIINLLFSVLISNELHFRIDMTEGKKFSISKITADLLKLLDNNLAIEYYYSDKCNAHPLMNQIVLYIKDILIEYESAGGKNVNVIIEELNYQKNREKVDDLEKTGFKFFPLSERKMGESRQTLAFSGIILRYKGKEKIISAITSDRGFEYLIDREIEKILGKKKVKTGIILSKTDKNYEVDFKSLKNALNIEFDDPLFLDSGDYIPADVAALIIIGGDTLTDYDIFQIDQFLVNGGKAFFAINGVNVLQYPDGNVSGKKNYSKLILLLESYGLYVEKYIIGDNESFYPVISNNEIFRYPVWPEIKSQNFNEKHMAVKGLKHLLLFWPSSVKFNNKIKDNTSVLFRTTSNAFSIKDNFELNINSYKLSVQSDEQKYDLAVSFDGELNSFFKNKQIPDSAINPKNKFSGIKKDSGTTKIVLIGNDVIFEDKYINEEYESIYLLLNSVDWLSGNEGMIEVRSRGRFSRPLDIVSKTGADSGFYVKKNLIIIISTYIMPLLFFVLAIIVRILSRIKNRELKLLYDKSFDAKVKDEGEIK